MIALWVSSVVMSGVVAVLSKLLVSLREYGAARWAVGLCGLALWLCLEELWRSCGGVVGETYLIFFFSVLE